MIEKKTEDIDKRKKQMILNKWHRGKVKNLRLKRSWDVINGISITNCEKITRISILIERAQDAINLKQWVNNKKGYKSMQGLQPGDILKEKKSNKKVYPPLTDEQRKRVYNKREPDDKERDKNFKLAESIVSKYLEKHPYISHRTDEDLEDLKMAVLHKMCQKATEYELGDAKFSTYAYKAMWHEVGHVIRDEGRLVKLTNGILDTRGKIWELKKEGLTEEEIKEKLKISDWKYVLCEMSWQDRHLSLDYTGDGEDDDETPVNQVSSPMSFFSKFSKEANDVVSKLSEKDFDLLDKYISNDKLSDTQRERASSLMKELRDQIKLNEDKAKQK